ncbi:MAG: hypothetical protein AB7P00_32680, partial [Sandaracinaceae bacterium]
MRRFSIAIAFVAGTATLALAQAAVPIPAWVQSVEVTGSGTTIRARPSTHAARRGTVQLGTHLPVLGRVLGEGCPGGEWIQIGADAFVCERLLRYSPAPPSGDTLPRLLTETALTPRMHAFVATDGAWAYARPNDYFADHFTESLGRGFGVAIVERREVDGIDMARTLGGLWIVARDLRWARPSDFRGVEVEDGTSIESIGWIVRDRAPIRERASGGRTIERASRLVRVTIANEARGAYELADGTFLSTRDVARPRLTTPPEEV